MVLEHLPYTLKVVSAEVAEHSYLEGLGTRFLRYEANVGNGLSDHKVTFPSSSFIGNK